VAARSAAIDILGVTVKQTIATGVSFQEVKKT
jgi:hypothetical protein